MELGGLYSCSVPRYRFVLECSILHVNVAQLAIDRFVNVMSTVALHFAECPVHAEPSQHEVAALDNSECTCTHCAITSVARVAHTLQHTRDVRTHCIAITGTLAICREIRCLVIAVTGFN